MFVSRDENPTNLLTEKFGSPIKKFSSVDNLKENENSKGHLTWRTPYGVSFSDIGFGNSMWGFDYDENLPFVDQKRRFNILSGQDIRVALVILEKEPNKLKEMPSEMKILQIWNPRISIQRHSGFGKWQAFISEKFSAFNNPLQSSLGYTKNEETFEIQFFSEKNPREYVLLTEVMKLVKNL